MKKVDLDLNITHPSVRRWLWSVDPEFRRRLNLRLGDNHNDPEYVCRSFHPRPVLQSYEPNNENKRLKNPALRNYLDVIFGDKQIWEVFLRVLEISPFLKRLTLNSIHVFSILIKHGARSNLLNALRRLEFWKDFPEQLIHHLQGRWQVEVKDAQFLQWLPPEIGESATLLKRFRRHEGRVVTMDTIIVEAQAYLYFTNIREKKSLAHFQDAVRLYTSRNPRAPSDTSLRQISKPPYGIWSKRPHESILCGNVVFEPGRGNEVPIRAVFQDFMQLFQVQAIREEITETIYNTSLFPDLNSTSPDCTLKPSVKQDVRIVSSPRYHTSDCVSFSNLSINVDAQHDSAPNALAIDSPGRSDLTSYTLCGTGGNSPGSIIRKTSIDLHGKPRVNTTVPTAENIVQGYRDELPLWRDSASTKCPSCRDSVSTINELQMRVICWEGENVQLDLVVCKTGEDRMKGKDLTDLHQPENPTVPAFTGREIPLNEED